MSAAGEDEQAKSEEQEKRLTPHKYLEVVEE